MEEKQLSKQKQKERIISKFFIQNARNELNEDFSFISMCDEENPPDFWANYKGEIVGIELCELHTYEAKGHLGFCEKIVKILENKEIPPVGISRSLESDKNFRKRGTTPILVADAIEQFLLKNPGIVDDPGKMNEAFEKMNPYLANFFILQKPHPDIKKVFISKIISTKPAEQIEYFSKNLKRKVEKIREKTRLKHKEKMILVFHFDQHSLNDTFIQFDLEILFAKFKIIFTEINSNEDFFRGYISSKSNFTLFGNKLKTLRLL